MGHEGGNAAGDFCHTLTITDVDTGWVDLYGLQNKAQRWTHEAIDAARQSLPIVMRGIDTDNGSEFINHHLLRYCEAHGITFTRGRPYRKNDTCYVEQKNGHVVRRAVGYLRYDTDRELAALNAIYRPLCLLVNFFYPSVKLVKKTRTGSKVRRIYDDPQTPYHRMLSSESVSEAAKYRLKQQYATLNPVALKRELTRLTEDLLQLNVSKTAQTADRTKHGAITERGAWWQRSHGKLTFQARLTVENRRNGRSAPRKTSPQARCKAPPPDEVVSGHPCDQRPNRLQTRPSLRSGQRHDTVLITSTGGERLSSTPRTQGRTSVALSWPRRVVRGRSAAACRPLAPWRVTRHDKWPLSVSAAVYP